jgi:CDP-6-deoxy-D-xylo-4-hexulose-3-dehydrase
LGILKKEDNVGFSALTWATNVMPLLELGLNACPIDISLKNLNVNSKNLLEVLKNNQIKALFITNLLGFCGDLNKIKEICREKGIILLEDNCESLGSELNGIKLGNFGLASSFSFFVGHHLSTIEGGMVCTENEELYNMLLMIRAHGWSRNLNEEKKEELKLKNNINNFYDKYTFYHLGYNLRPTEITGFLGVEQLKFLDKMIEKREDNFKEYHEIAKNNQDIMKLDFDHMNLVSNFDYPLILANNELSETYKKRFENRVEIRPIVGGFIVEQPFFKKYVGEKNIKYDCPNSKLVHKHGFYIPNNPELTDEEKQIILSILKKD